MDSITHICRSKKLEEIFVLCKKTGATTYWIDEAIDPETGEIVYVFKWIDGKSLEDLEQEPDLQMENKNG